MREIEEIVSALLATRTPAALATLVRVEGSSYRRPGARLLSMGDTRIGSISGGCLEEDILLRAERVRTLGVAEIAVYDTTDENDLVWGVGMGCRGIVHVLIEPIPTERPVWLATLAGNLVLNRSTELAVSYATQTGNSGTALATGTASEKHTLGVFHETIEPPEALFVFGAGDDAQPLVHLAQSIGWRVTVGDVRPAYAIAARFPGAKMIAGMLELEAMIQQIPPEALVVVMSHRYESDRTVLRALLPRQMTYLGILGPRKRTEGLLQALEAEGIALPADRRARLYAPVGLDLGASTAAEIAVAVVAEMMACVAGRIPIHLRDRGAAIHERVTPRTTLSA